MAAKYYRDAEGNYIGAFDGVDPPEGAIEVPVAPQVATARWNGTQWMERVGRDQVLAERDRRLELGFDYDFGDARGVHRIGTTEADMRAWDREVTPFANALVATGDTTTKINLMTDTGPVSVTGAEWQDILIVAAAVRQPIWAASFTLAAMDPIPSDYTNDSYWV